MPPSDLHKDSLQRETERQNRIYLEAIARKKTPLQQGPAAGARIEPQLTEFTSNGVVNSGVGIRPDPGVGFGVPREAAAAPRVETGAAAALSMQGEASVAAEEPAQQLAAMLTHVPEMRSALVPLDTPAHEVEWSKPFSLTRADIEPWLSYYMGYRQSRLFREGLAGAAFDPASGAPLDFAVLALLKLRQADSKFIFDPPVRISGHVMYAELDEELRACRNAQEARVLVDRATQAHEIQLRAAIDRGRQMGNLLYDSLMGEGHVNLINAWEDAHKRKPTVEELHLMLTAGRTEPALPKRPQAAAASEECPNEQKPGAAAVSQSVPPEPPPKPAMRPPEVRQPEVRHERVAPQISPRPAVVETAVRAAQHGTDGWMEKKLDTLSPRKRILVPIAVAAACSAALIALGLNGFI